MDAIRNWVLGLIGAAMVSAAAMAVTPEGRVKKVVGLVCGVITVIALAAPLSGMDYTELSETMAGYRENAAKLSSDAGETNEMLNRLIIEEDCAAYILDKGTALGIEGLKISVSAKWSTDGYWYPYNADIRTDSSASGRAELSKYIEAGLGIPEDRQNWYTESEDEGDA